MRTLTENGKTFVLVPIERYEHLLGKNENQVDITAYDEAMQRGEESFPIELFDAIDEGKSPILVFREYRKIKQSALAKTTGISVPYLSQIENGLRKGSIKSIKAIAETLRVNIDMLI